MHVPKFATTQTTVFALLLSLEFYYSIQDRSFSRIAETGKQSVADFLERQFEWRGAFAVSLH